MKKYLSVFKISFQQEFVYRLNFIMWRVRNVLQIFLIFFLWNAVFSQPGAVVFGYDRAKILTYVFGILVLRAVVFSARTVDVSGEISSGDLTNYLLKPVSYFKYWFTRDLSSKALNLGFAAVETTILFLILKPVFFLQTNPTLVLAFAISIILAVFLYFHLLFIVNLVAFWMPESGWAFQFLFMVIIAEFLSGGIFPLDILPLAFQKVIYLMPFPYVLFFPLQVYLGKIATSAIIVGLVTGGLWLVILNLFLRTIWNRGLRRYEAVGR